MATIATPVVTWEAFERLPDSDGFHRELIKGELQILPPAKFGHGQIAANVYDTLFELKKLGLGAAYLEVGYKLTDNPPSWVQPDVSFLTADRIAEIRGNDYPVGAPNLAVEIISPSETAADIEQKVSLLLETGCQTIWVIYPKTQTVHVFTPGGHATICNNNETLPALALAPDLLIPVAKLFAV
jgi:Uma2 family endonuclease